MYYTIYKITNAINNKIYIGKHKTKKLDDNYMGSGKHLKRSIAKYGIDNFIKEILFIFDNENDMNVKERELVTEEFCLRDDTYNICVGGQGGFSYINSNNHRNGIEHRLENQRDYNKLANIAFKQKYYNDELFRLNFIKSVSSGVKKHYEKNGSHWKGKKHSQETKDKISLNRSGSGLSEANSQYGTMWITNGSCNKKIKKTEPIPNGWYKGRVN